MKDDTLYEEVAVADILNRSTNINENLVIDPKISELPLSSLTWMQFEKLATTLINDKFKECGGLRAFRYGLSGQKQHGFDITAINNQTEKNIVAECKKVKTVSKQQLSGWVNKFIDGARVESTEYYLLITTAELKDTSLIDEWNELSIKLKKLNIACEVWDYNELISLLRKLPLIVDEFYGSAIKDGFCSNLFDPGGYTQLFKEKDITRYENHVTLSNKTITLDMYLPDKRSSRLSCGFSFARTDLNGFSIACESEFLIKLIQSRKHCETLLDTGYFYEISSTGRYVFDMPSVKFCITREEIEHLDWILIKTWDIYYDQVSKLEEKFKTIRFSKYPDKDNVFKLFKIEKWFWKELISYTKEYDFLAGDSEHFIFSSSGYLQVYTSGITDRLDSGHHLIMRPHAGDHLDSDYYVLGWEPITGYGHDIDISPRKHWDAEFTHNWLLTYLFPRVYEWAIERYKNRIKKSGLINSLKGLMNTKKIINYPDIDSLFTSYANVTTRNIGRRLTSLYEVKEVVATLQCHFHTYRSKAKIEDELIICVADASISLLSSKTSYRNHYVKSNFRLESEDIYAELSSVDITKNLSQSGGLDAALSALGGILDDLESLNDHEISTMTNLLEPVWNRYHEDLLCGTYN